MTEVERNYVIRRNGESMKYSEKKHHNSPYFLISCFGILLMYVLWQLSQYSYSRIFSSVSAGCLLVYYTFELIYFDSLTPGIQPTSPLSPASIRSISGHTLHLNYALAVIIGVFFTLFVCWYM